MDLAMEYTASKTFTRKVALPTGVHGAKVMKGNKRKTSPSCIRFLSPRGSCAVDPRYTKGKLAIKALMVGKETRMEWEPTEVYLSRPGGPLVWVPLFPWSPFGVVPAPAAFGGLIVQAPSQHSFNMSGNMEKLLAGPAQPSGSSTSASTSTSSSKGSSSSSSSSSSFKRSRS